MPANWRVGSKIPLNVYEGDRPVCQCHTPEDAARIVGAMNALHGIQTEIGAGKCLFPKNDEERTWNNAHDRALSIVANYIEGFGLFQMTARMEKKPK